MEVKTVLLSKNFQRLKIFGLSDLEILHFQIIQTLYRILLLNKHCVLSLPTARSSRHSLNQSQNLVANFDDLREPKNVIISQPNLSYIVSLLAKFIKTPKDINLVLHEFYDMSLEHSILASFLQAGVQIRLKRSTHTNWASNASISLTSRFFSYHQSTRTARRNNSTTIKHRSEVQERLKVDG
jgi:hypothetical protein